jgi:aldehyde dehydrogenase (NAD+)
VDVGAAVYRRGTVGDGTDESTRLGPLVSKAQRRRVAGYIEKGIADGATVITGGPGPSYTDDDHAVEIANNTIYGLNGAVYGETEHVLAIAKRCVVDRATSTTAG